MRLVLVLTSLCAALVQAPAFAESYVFLAGRDDGFAAPSDRAFPTQWVFEAYATIDGQTMIDFDARSPNHAVGHTFTSLPKNIVGGQLELGR
jgi:hypothetical protein